MWNKSKGKLRMKKLGWLLLLGFADIIVGMLLLMLCFYSLEKHDVLVYLMIFFVMVAINILGYLLLKYMPVKEKKTALYESSKLQRGENGQVYDVFGISSELQSNMMRNYGNQLHCIRGLLEGQQYQRAKQYTERLMKVFYEDKEVVDVHNPIINMILNQKYYLAKEKGIAMLFQVSDLSGIWMEEKDIVALLSNLLDHAMEASENSENQKCIQLKIVYEKKQLIFSIKNTLKEPVSIENNFSFSRKKQKMNFGSGLKNVQSILEKYDGRGMMWYENGWFCYTAAIPKSL